MKNLWLIIIVLAAAGILAGCAQKQQIAPEPKCLSGFDKGAAMKASEQVLTGMNFVIDKSDSNLGTIITKPMAGSQFFEFWQKDNVGGYNRALSNLHSIQRTVILDFNEIQGQVCVACKVEIERLSIPEKEIDSASRAYTMFSRSSESTQNLYLNEEQEKKMCWVNIGRDNRLETVVLDKIAKHISMITAKGKKK